MKKIAVNLVLSSILCLTVIGCGKKSAEDQMRSASKNVESKNISEAVVNYESVIKDYPESKEAPEALYQLGSLYQNHMVVNFAPKESFQKAINTFSKLIDKYPDSPQAPRALFMTGFIQANELNNFDAATKTYNLFLEKYPNHELASSAKEELDNMGLSPEQILQKKSASGT